MSPTFYSFLHVLGVLMLTATTFQAFARPDPERKRAVLMRSGIYALVALVGGFGLLAKLKYGFPGWVVVKLVAWLILAALAGIAFRKPAQAGQLTAVAMLVVAAALYAVYFKPF
jgi:hypothetical protein